MIVHRIEDYLTDGIWDPEKSQDIAYEYKELLAQEEAYQRKTAIKEWIIDQKLTAVDIERFQLIIEGIPDGEQDDEEDSIIIDVPEVILKKRLTNRQVYQSLPDPRKRIIHKTHIQRGIMHYPRRPHLIPGRGEIYHELHAIMSY